MSTFHKVDLKKIENTLDFCFRRCYNLLVHGEIGAKTIASSPALRYPVCRLTIKVYNAEARRLVPPLGNEREIYENRTYIGELSPVVR